MQIKYITPQSAKALRDAHTLNEVPEGYISMTSVVNRIRELYPIEEQIKKSQKLVKMTGGDRFYENPDAKKNPFCPVFVGPIRFVPEEITKYL